MEMLNVHTLIMSGGLILLGTIIFAEVGLFLGFFLPGDTLVIAAGVYAKQGHFSIASVILVCAVAAIAGDSLGYYFGRRLGPRVFTKEDSILFRPDHVARADKFFSKYGPKTLLISHFIAVVRTFTPLLAGVAGMPYKRFLAFNITGDIFWAVSVGLLGYYVGSRIPNIDHYIVLALGFVVLVTLIPTLYHIGRIQVSKRKKAGAVKDDKPAPKN
jgi:membrane-associated protein